MRLKALAFQQIVLVELAHEGLELIAHEQVAEPASVGGSLGLTERGERKLDILIGHADAGIRHD